MENYLCNVVFAELPKDVYSLSTKADDGKFIIVINSSLTKEESDKCLLHEFENVRNRNYEKTDNLSVLVEYEAHKGT